MQREGMFRKCKEFVSLLSSDTRKEQVMKNKSRKGGRTDILDGFVYCAKLIGFPNTMPTSISGDI